MALDFSVSGFVAPVCDDAIIFTMIECNFGVGLQDVVDFIFRNTMTENTVARLDELHFSRRCCDTFVRTGRWVFRALTHVHVSGQVHLTMDLVHRRIAPRAYLAIRRARGKLHSFQHISRRFDGLDCKTGTKPSSQKKEQQVEIHHGSGLVQLRGYVNGL